MTKETKITTAPSSSKAAKPKKPAAPTRGLGRGLSALMSDISVTGAIAASQKPSSDTQAQTKIKPAVKQASTDNAQTLSASTRGVATLAIDQIVRNPDQPRRHFDKALLEELTHSIADKGVLQPILVRPVPSRDKTDGDKAIFQIVAGERRWQASLKAGLTSMPALVRELSDQDVLEIGVVENVQRADLNPIEEALAYRALVDQFSRTQEEIAKAIGKSRPHIANMLRLLSLPKRAQDALQSGLISTGHARAVIAAPDPNALVEQIIDKGLSVRDAESWVRRIKAAEDNDAHTLPKAAPEVKSADIARLERDLSDKIGVRVELNHKGPSGEIKLKYATDAQLDRLLEQLGKL